MWPTKRRLKGGKAVKFSRRLERNLNLYRAGQISFAELDASVQGWINHVSYGDTWGLRQHVFRAHPIRAPRLDKKLSTTRAKRESSETRVQSDRARAIEKGRTHHPKTAAAVTVVGMVEDAASRASTVLGEVQQQPWRA